MRKSRASLIFLFLMLVKNIYSVLVIFLSFPRVITKTKNNKQPVKYTKLNSTRLLATVANINETAPQKTINTSYASSIFFIVIFTRP